METGDLRYAMFKGSARAPHADPGIAMAAVPLTGVTVVALVHSHPLVLPLLSIILVMAALVLAALVAIRHRSPDVSLIDRMHLAGVILFFGFAASMLGDPDAAVKSLAALMPR